jgi:hypothetical protein
MKLLRVTTALLGLALASSLTAAALPPARVEVTFSHPENFTDAKDRDLPSDSGRDEILSRIKGFVVASATPLLPAGSTFAITFTDVDLAGEFEPWHVGQLADVRIVKSVYPPAFKFTYSVTAADGRVLAHGNENIRDLGFDLRPVFDPSDALHFEKAFLDDWIHSNLHGLK